MRTIKINFSNGLEFDTFKKAVFDINGLSSEFLFERSENPDFVIFGPYGNEIPKKGNYERIGYFCENVKPDLNCCEWAFGIPLESEIENPKYKRIQWHGFDPNILVKQLTDNDIDMIVNTKKKFCNFLYSNPVPYREEFFRELSKYKKIDAPGKSMNNHPPIDSLYKGDVWDRKRLFLSEYKFTIAFENYSYPGYQTEKLYDAMREFSIPIYCGDPNISDIFNFDSFVDCNSFVAKKRSNTLRLLEKYSQPNFIDIRPQFYNAPLRRIKRKLKSVGREMKMKHLFNRHDFQLVIDKIIELDTNEDLYIQYLKRPWFFNNKVPEDTLGKAQWIKIFESRP